MGQNRPRRGKIPEIGNPENFGRCLERIREDATGRQACLKRSARAIYTQDADGNISFGRGVYLSNRS